MYVFIFVVAIVAAIIIHEFGHFATAKAFGMRVEKFFAGFGPTLWSVRKGETEYGVKAIPAGGFVKITGMSPYEEFDSAAAGRTFYEQPAWQRAIVLAAGSVTHFVIAIVLLFAALWLVGVPTGQASTTVDLVSEGSPAAAAGLQVGDEIVAIDGIPADGFDEVRDLVSPRGGQTVTLTVVREGERVELATTLASETPDGQPQGFLGVAPRPEVRPLPFGEALGATFVGDFSVVRLTQLTVVGIGEAFSPQGLASWVGQLSEDAPRQAEGPVSLVGAGQIAGALGAQGDVFGFLIVIVSINIVIGLLNLLPLPPLDGGHLAVLAAEKVVNVARRVRGLGGYWRPDPAKLTPVALAVILLFGMIFFTALFIDIVRPASEILQ